MKTSFISTNAQQNAMRLTIQRSNIDISRLQNEVVTGRLYDVGEAVGAKAGQSLSLKRELARLDNIKASNSLVQVRLESTQLSLSAMSDQASELVAAFVSVQGTSDETRLAIANQQISSAYGGFIASVNLSSSGEYLFGGINTDTQPVSDYTAAGSAAKTTFDNAFLGYFGFAQTDPAAAGITAAQMDDFLTNTLEPLYSGTQWNTDWSSASDTNVSSRINRTDLVQTGTNANTKGIREFMLATVIGFELLNAPLSDEVRGKVVESASKHADQAATFLDRDRSRLGISENRVTNANTSIESQVKILTTQVNDIEGVDVYEASTRLNSLLAQVETSYTLTARIQQLSLINFL